MPKLLKDRALTLAAAARRLNSAHRARAPFSLAFLTDRTRIADPASIAMALPRGAALILRDYDAPERRAMAQTLKRICAERGVLFLVGGDAALARRMRADGVHLRSDQLSGPRPPFDIVSASCHSAAELRRARALGADIAFLGPVFATASHPGAGAMGASAFKTLARLAALPVLALGGVDEKNASLLAGANVAGFGAIGAFSPAQKS